MQGFFKKKFPLPKFKREEMEETVCFIFISFAISKSFIPKFLTFCGKNYGLLSKTTKPMCFQSHAVWLWNFWNCFKPQMHNYLAKNI